MKFCEYSPGFTGLRILILSLQSLLFFPVSVCLQSF